MLTPATLCTALYAVMSESDASAAISGARPAGCEMRCSQSVAAPTSIFSGEISHHRYQLALVDDSVLSVPTVQADTIAVQNRREARSARQNRVHNVQAPQSDAGNVITEPVSQDQHPRSKAKVVRNIT